MAYLEREERSEATRKQYYRDVITFFNYTKGEQLSKELIIRYKEMLQEKYRPASVNAKLAAINGFFSFMGAGQLKVKQLKFRERHFVQRKGS